MNQEEKTLGKNRKKKIFQGLALVMFGLIVGFLCVETGLRIMEAMKVDWVFFASEGISEYSIEDEKLGIRLAPNAPGHDANGFRNKEVPESVDIVAIGDSQTWGINAAMKQAWPQALSSLSGDTTYNMGLGFYNTIDYYVLTDEAFGFDPDTIVVGLYFGNDIQGTYSTVYNNDYFSWLRDDETVFSEETRIAKAEEMAVEQQEYRPWIETSVFSEVGSWMTKHSRTLRLVWTSWLKITNVKYKADLAWAQGNSADGAVYEVNEVTYVLSPTYRLMTLDLENPGIIEGLRISSEVLGMIKEKTDDRGVNLLIALIPTQESAFVEAIEQAGAELNENYLALVDMETRVRNEIIAVCEENDISYVNLLPDLSAAVSGGEKIYPPTIDGHPLPDGYAVIASGVNDALNDLDW